MATITTCDRCGVEITYSKRGDASVTVTILPEGKYTYDLCVGCKMMLKRFLDRLPELAPKGTGGKE